MIPVVSVVIPVYNIDKLLLESCLTSIINQTFKDIEIVIVNDGSTDDTLSYCESFLKRDSRITVINQKNQGVSEARNNGTVAAKGAYILYVDGDDILSASAIEEGLLYIKSTNCDLVIAAVKKINHHSEFSEEMLNKTEFEVFTPDRYDELKRHYVGLNIKKFKNIQETGYINRGPYCRLIKKEIAVKNKFPGAIPIGEDLIWNMNLLDSCESVCVVFHQWYGYLTNTSSAIRKYYGNRKELIEKYMKILIDNQKDFCGKNKKIVAKNLSVELYCLLRYEYMSDKCKMSFIEKNRVVRHCLKESPWNILCKEDIRKSLSRKYRIMLMLCRLGLWQMAFKIIYKDK